jgi:hypothetical protein
VTTSGESGQAGQIRRRTILFHKWRSRYLYLPILPIPFLDGEATRAGQKKKNTVVCPGTRLVKKYLDWVYVF